MDIVFRVKDFCVFGGIFLCSVIGLVRKKASYRRVEKYYKTTGQYWKERKQRLGVLCLLEKEQLTQRQLAERLGVSERTVRRDIAKLRSYQESKFRHQLKLWNREWGEKLGAELAGKTVFQQLKTLEQKATQYSKALKMRDYYRHQIYVSLDVDKLVYGFPEVRFWPKNFGKFSKPITINFQYVKNKKQFPFSKITIN